MKKSRWVALALCGGLAIGTIGGVYSYFTSRSDSLSNNFSIVKSGGNREDAIDRGEIDEPNWDEDDEEGLHENVQPRAKLRKDPYYQSTAEYPGHVYMEITVPTANSEDVSKKLIEIEGEDVKVGTELIYLGETNDDLDGKTGWTLLGKEDVEGIRTYIYKYNDILAPQSRTDLPVFDDFTIKDLNIYLSTQDLSIDITGRIVQSEGIDAPETLTDYNKMFNIKATNINENAVITTMSLRRMEEANIASYNITYDMDSASLDEASYEDIEAIEDYENMEYIDYIEENDAILDATEDDVQ